MNPSQYLLYAGVTSPLLLAIIYLSIAFHGWMQQRVFRANTAYAYAIQKVALSEMLEDEDVTFDEHVEAALRMTDPS